MDTKYLNAISQNPGQGQGGEGDPPNPQGSGQVPGNQRFRQNVINRVRGTVASTLGNAAETARLSGMTLPTAHRIIDLAFQGQVGGQQKRWRHRQRQSQQSNQQTLKAGSY